MVRTSKKSIVIATDSLKGTLSAQEASTIVEEVAASYPAVRCYSIPMADGGEGTLDALEPILGGVRRRVMVCGPLWQPVEASYLLLPDHVAVIEMAQASGLTLITPVQRDPLLTTTYGTGQLIRDALNQGATTLYITLGGSATNDGGIGCLRALGARFINKNGHELEGVGGDLAAITQVDMSGMDERLQTTRVVLLCDVTNPLCGSSGATCTFGPQKGATPEMLSLLEAGMHHWTTHLQQVRPFDENMSGLGAAGGLAAALYVCLNAEIQSGVEAILQLTHFDEAAVKADLVVTGEGRIDGQSAQGKVLSGVVAHCRRLGVRVVALVGSQGIGAEKMLEQGLSAIYVAQPQGLSSEQAMATPKKFYREAACAMLKKEL